MKRAWASARKLATPRRQMVANASDQQGTAGDGAAGKPATDDDRVMAWHPPHVLPGRQRGNVRGQAMSDGGSVERVRAALLAAGHPDSIRAFPEGTRTAADAAAAIGCTVAQIAKSIVFRAGERAVVVVTSGANRVDTGKAASALGVALKRADADWVRAVTGFAIGGVAPVGHVTAPLVLLDEDLLALDPVWAAAGSPSHVYRTTAAELVRVTGARVARVKAG